MSDLRFFAETMHELIAAERRLHAIQKNGDVYVAACAAIRSASAPKGDRPSSDFIASTEGINAARIILASATEPRL